MSLRYKAAIVGAAETTQLGVVPDVSETGLHIDAAVNAMRDSGIDKDQIDGIATTMSPATLANYLGIVPRWIDNTQVGGTSFLIHVRHAAAAIASGLATTVLVAMGQSGRSRVGVAGGRGGGGGRGMFRSGHALTDDARQVHHDLQRPGVPDSRRSAGCFAARGAGQHRVADGSNLDRRPDCGLDCVRGESGPRLPLVEPSLVRSV